MNMMSCSKASSLPDSFGSLGSICGVTDAFHAITHSAISRPKLSNQEHIWYSWKSEVIANTVKMSALYFNVEGRYMVKIIGST